MTQLKKVFCANCKKPIYRSNGRINESIKFKWNFYCSKKCKSQYKSKKKLLICESCSKSFTRRRTKISPHNYCSCSCAAQVNNKKYPKRQAKLKTCIKCKGKFKKSTGNLKYCSMKCKREAEQKSPQELIKIIRKTADKLKRVPAKRELKEITDTCRRTFGSWNNAIIAAGLKPNRSHNQRMYKCTNIKAIDGHLCDSVSEAIIDNWLTKNKIPHKINTPYPTTNHKADWLINIKKQKVFVEYFGLAKDSPRYDRCVRKKKKLCKKHKLKLIEIYPQDIYSKKSLDNNLRNKFKELTNI